jgi:hypothetical protein
VVESSGLLNRRRGLNLYRGFESPPLRQRFQVRFTVSALFDLFQHRLAEHLIEPGLIASALAG